MCIRDRVQLVHDDPPNLSLADLAQQLLKLRSVGILAGIAFVLKYPAGPTFQFILAEVNLTNALAKKSQRLAAGTSKAAGYAGGS